MTAREFQKWMKENEEVLKAEMKATREAKEKAEDDYYDRLGEIVERHPICSPHAIRSPLK